MYVKYLIKMLLFEPGFIIHYLKNNTYNLILISALITVISIFL